ncbi:MAG: 5-formyltetrahydrofolate cyclo-ligase [Pseudomonadota bacterium]
MDLRGAKRAARRAAKDRRARLSAAMRKRAAKMVCDRLARLLGAPDGRVLAGFWPLHDEVDLRPALVDWHRAGGAVLLPRVQGPDAPLTFHRWTPGTALIAGAFGVQEPAADALSGTPDVLLVPLLAADLDGYRLGYGGGYYDRTLAGDRPALVVGVAFEAQVVTRLPRDRFDQPLTHLVTDVQLRSFDASPGA